MYKNCTILEEKMCKELESLEEKYRTSNSEMTVQDLEKIDKLYHALKSKATYEAMKEYDENDDFEGVSGRRGRDGMGRYISRDMSHEMSRRDWPNYQRDEWSGHYYPPMYYPPNYR